MYDIVYEFIIDTFLDTAGAIPQHYEALALLMTHTTMILFYFALVSLIVHVFNAFRTMTRWW
jgi:hypothetical protein